MGPHPAVAELRLAVRRCLAELAPGELVLAACSGGADSLALAAALAFVAPRLGLRAGSVTVDHRLQPGSAEQARRVAVAAAGLGLDPAHVVAVTVGGRGGPEAAARAARYEALEKIRREAGAAIVLLAHTRDDQAETLLLGLARGSGSRSLAGMAERSGHYWRPLLGVSRATARTACAELGLRPWEDPHNADSGYARARVRHHALPVLEATLGPGVAEALARTARQLRADADALDEFAAAAIGQLTAPDHPAPDHPAPDHPAPDHPAPDHPAPDHPAPGVDVAGLARLPGAVRTRVLRRLAVQAGCPPGALAARHVEMLDGLVTGWHGQRWVDLPGEVRGVRECGKLRLVASGQPEGAPPGADNAEGADGRERSGSGPQRGADPPAAAAGADHGAGRAD